MVGYSLTSAIRAPFDGFVTGNRFPPYASIQLPPTHALLASRALLANSGTPRPRNSSTGRAISYSRSGGPPITSKFQPWKIGVYFCHFVRFLKLSIKLITFLLLLSHLTPLYLFYVHLILITILFPFPVPLDILTLLFYVLQNFGITYL